MAGNSFTPTLKMAANANRGLKLRDKFGRGGTQASMRRAHELAERRAVSERHVKSMASCFFRHKIDKEAAHIARTAKMTRMRASSPGCCEEAMKAANGL